MFSKACEYGMRATIYVAQQTELNNKVGVKEIAEAIESPEAFTGKIMQKLSKNYIVRSIKGPYGGFYIDEKSMANTKLSDIIKLFDGQNSYSGCILGLKNCNSNTPCPIHKDVEHILDDLRDILETKTLHDVLYEKTEKKIFWLKVV